jgi:hypothetical protein
LIAQWADVGDAPTVESIPFQPGMTGGLDDVQTWLIELFMPTIMAKEAVRLSAMTPEKRRLKLERAQGG